MGGPPIVQGAQSLELQTRVAFLTTEGTAWRPPSQGRTKETFGRWGRACPCDQSQALQGVELRRGGGNRRKERGGGGAGDRQQRAPLNVVSSH